jgi:nitroreductase
MHVTDAIKLRKSVRSYLNKQIEDEKLAAVLNAARLSPSPRNAQERRFVIVRDAGRRERIAEAAENQPHVREAPVIIAGCAETAGRITMCGQPAYTLDVTIALDHAALAATELGLGTCWICRFDEKKVKEILGIPEKIRVVALMLMGYATDPALVEKERLPLDTIVKHEQW